MIATVYSQDSGKVIGTIDETVDCGEFFYTGTMEDGTVVAAHWSDFCAVIDRIVAYAKGN